MLDLVCQAYDTRRRTRSALYGSPPSRPDNEAALFPVHMRYVVLHDFIFGRLTVADTRAGDLVRCAIRNDSSAHQVALWADLAALRAKRDAAAVRDTVDHLLEVHFLMMKYRSITHWASYHAQSRVHEQTIVLASLFHLQLESIRAGQTLGQAEIIAHAGKLYVVRPACQGVEITLELGNLV